jgi:hypothetical protein
MPLRVHYSTVGAEFRVLPLCGNATRLDTSSGEYSKVTCQDCIRIVEDARKELYPAEVNAMRKRMGLGEI